MSVNNSYLNNIFKRWVKIFILFTVLVFHFVICVCVTANPNKITGTVNVYQAEDATVSNDVVQTDTAITIDVNKSVAAKFTGEQIKIALWGDSRENRDKANEQITKILLDVVTDWDMCVHTGDYTPGGSAGNWEKAINYPRAKELLYSGKFYMCTSNHDDVLSTYDQYTEGVLPTNSVNGKTHFYHHQEGNVHIVACDKYFTNSSVMQNWLDQTLESINPDDWIIGFWHPPCYGDVTYKSSYLSTCRGWLNSLYSKGGDMIFHGHAHVYVRTYPLLPDETVDPSGMVHIVNGCGGASFKEEQPHTVHTAFTPYSGSFGCITFLTFKNDTVYLETIDARDGKNMAVIDSWQWTREPSSHVLPQEKSWSASVIPDKPKLVHNYPNPFNPITYISYNLPRTGYVRLTVFDVQGRLVKTLVDGVKREGEHKEIWEAVDFSGRHLPSGVYFCRLQVGSHVETIKMMFIR